MKRFTTILFAFLLITLMSTLAYAGILGTAKDWVLDNALNTIIASVFMLIAAFFGGTTWGKAVIKGKIPILELRDVCVKVRNARRPTSAGGKKITDEEKDAILKEVEELIASVINIFGKKIL